ncbi:MAG: NAD synthetase, partial [Burkholderiaceae bacterium]|nr:NAD synthetase [Burkholderiaceae bacterium]
MSNFTAISYLVSSVLFILALKGLSSPTTSRQGNVFGMVGMALAVVTTFLIPSFKPVYWLIGVAIIGGAIIGSIAAQRVQMTKMPELV